MSRIKSYRLAFVALAMSLLLVPITWADHHLGAANTSSIKKIDSNIFGMETSWRER